MLLLAIAAALQAVPAPASSTPLCIGGAQVSAREDCPRFVFFDSAGVEVRREWQEVLDAAAARMRELQGARVTVVGHSDRSGPTGANRRVSLARANLIRDALITRGVAADSITVEGHGEQQPLIATEDGVREPQNRRVEIRISSAP